MAPEELEAASPRFLARPAPHHKVPSTTYVSTAKGTTHGRAVHGVGKLNEDAGVSKSGEELEDHRRVVRQTRRCRHIQSSVHAFIRPVSASASFPAERPARADSLRSIQPQPSASKVQRRLVTASRPARCRAGRRRCAAYDECEREPSHPSGPCGRNALQPTHQCEWCGAAGQPRSAKRVVRPWGVIANLTPHRMWRRQRSGRVLTPNANAKMSEAPRAAQEAPSRITATRDLYYFPRAVEARLADQRLPVPVKGRCRGGMQRRVSRRRRGRA